MVSRIQKPHKRKLHSFTTKSMVHLSFFFKGCDVYVFFVEEIIEAVSSIAKSKNKWIFE